MPGVRYLVCRIKWEGSRQILALSTGYRVDPDKWDAEAQRCRPGSFHGPGKVPGSEINAEIDRFTHAVREELARLGPDPDREELSRRIRLRLGLRSAKGTPSVREAYRSFVASQSALQGWSLGTLRKMQVVGRHIDDSGLFPTFNAFTPAGLQRYLNYMREDLRLNDATVHRQLGYLRWFLRWAEEQCYLTRTEWRAFRPKLRTPPRPVVYLDWPELMRLWSFSDPVRPWHEAVRDVFCFCAFTSLRYSDAVALTWADVGADAIRVTTQKTHDALTIELNKWSREILARRQASRRPDGRVFAPVTNQVMNRALKEICRECAIDAPVRRTYYRGARRIDEVRPKWEMVGTHAARRTFVVNALQMGISPTVVMQWTGHSDYDAMKPYIAVVDAARARAMQGFDALDPGAQ